MVWAYAEQLPLWRNWSFLEHDPSVFVMDNTNIDLNQEWDEDNFVPSTQFTGQSPMSLAQTLPPLAASHTTYCSPQIHAGQSHSPLLSQLCASRTPLSRICDNTLHQLTPPKKIAKPSKGKKMFARHRAPANSILAASAACDPPPPPNTNHTIESEVTLHVNKPIPSNLFFRSSHWSLRETITLMDARVKLLEEMKSGNLGVVMKTQDERWEYISKYCLQHGALRSPNQCLFRWDRILAAFKKIHNYERRIPFGKDSYLTMKSNQRDEMKLPRSFEQDLYEAMLHRVGSERMVNPGNILYDTSNDILEDASPPPSKDPKHAKEGETLEGEPSLSSGKKWKREDKMTNLKKDLEGTTKQLISLMEGIDSRREKHDDDIMELTKAEFEEVVALNRKRLALEEESNATLKQIAEAFSCFAMHATPSFEKHAQ